MPEQIRCPSCQSALRVPETLVGQNVKCPKCATTFLAEVEELAQPEGIVRERTPAANVSREIEEGDNEISPREDFDRPRRRRRDRSCLAASMVAGPAIALMVSSSLGIVSNIFFLLYRVIGEMYFGSQMPANRPGYEAGYIFGLVTAISGAILGLLMCIAVLVGAIKMKSLQNRGFALTACILSILSPNCCCILGLPFGIWGLVVLNNTDVRNSFS